MIIIDFWGKTWLGFIELSLKYNRLFIEEATLDSHEKSKVFRPSLQVLQRCKTNDTNLLSIICLLVRFPNALSPLQAISGAKQTTTL